MAAPHGIAGQFGYKTETVVGTAVVVDTFVPILSEGMAANNERIESKGLIAGRLVTAKWKAGQKLYSGSMEFELWNLSIAALLLHMFGTVTTSGTTPNFTHTYIPGSLLGKSFTAQVGRPDIAGTVQPFTWAGCKIDKWKIGAKVGDIATMSLDTVAMTELTTTALATASYAAGLMPFVFTEASLSIAGTPVATVKDLELTGDNALKERVRLGAATSREHIGTDFREYGGQLTADFESLTAYARIAAGTEAALVAAFTNGTETLTITENVRFDGDSPSLSGPDVLEQPLKFKAVSATSDAAAITAVLLNADVQASVA